VGLGAALEYLERLGRERVAAHEQCLLSESSARLREIPGLELVGTAAEKSGVVSFTVQGVHPHDVGTILDQAGVAVRSGHHCAMPIMERYGIPATARASFAFYNNRADVDRLIVGLQRAVEIFRG